MFNTTTPILQGENFIIEELDYIPLGTHQAMYSRPYIMTAQQDCVNQIADKLNERQSTLLDASLVQGAMSGMLQPNAAGFATVVNNGWVTQPRYIFLLKVRSIDAMGIETISYIQGFTDYNGISPTGLADPMMNHRINAIIETNIQQFSTPAGIVRTEKLYRFYNVLASSGATEVYTQRPTDILETIHVSDAATFLSEGGVMASGVTLGNMLTPWNNLIQASDVTNDIGADYLCRVINAGVHSAKEKSLYLNSYELGTTNTVLQQEPSLGDNRFVKYLSRFQGALSVKSDFPYNILTQIDPTIDSRFTVIQITKNYVDPLLGMTPEVGDHWQGQDMITLKAYSLIESAVSMATSLGMQKLFFKVTNMHNVMGTAEVFINNYGTKMGLDAQSICSLLDIFKTKFITEVFLPETTAGRIPMYADIYVDLLGTSKIYLEYAGYQGNWYTIPTPANSLFSPMLTADKVTLDAVCQQFSDVIETIAQGTSSYRSWY